MNRFIKTGAVFLLGILGCVCPLAAQTADIGKITLSGPNFGYQTVGIYNLTGATQGCEQSAAQYNVCNGVNIATWQLTINFTANASGIAPSPLVFTSNGTNDQIPPTNSTFDAYTGQAGNPWSLSFSLKNAGCSPACDATISSITFSGTLDTNSLNLYNTSAAGPYILDSLPSTAFSVTWNIPAADYTSTPGALFDSTDVLITNQPQLTSQSITFGALGDLLLTATPPALSASATSGLAVTFTSNNTAVCTVSETATTLASAGICSITASQPGDTTYAAATPVTRTFNVTQASQTITFGPLSDLAITATPAALSATATSSLAVDFTSNTTSVCTLDGTAITLAAGGTCSITASQAGNTTYAPAPTVTQTFQVTLPPQTITFGPIGNQLLTAGGSLALTATASSSLAVSYTSNTLGICTVSDSTVAFVMVGACSITADQPGDSSHAAAASVTQIFNIQASQTITFGPISSLALDATPPALSASASSGLAVIFASTTQSVCTVSVAALTLVTAGTCSINATQAGDTTHAAAATVTQTFTVLATQTITFGPISNIALTATAPALSATASSGLAVLFASDTPLVCTVSGTAVALVTKGTCSITASQAGDSTRAAAPTVTQKFDVLASQTITFGPISNLAITATAPALSATASSNLDVTFASTTSPVCTVSRTTVTLVSAGLCSITASQGGNGTYAPAPDVVQTFNVQPNQTITFGPISNIGLNATPPALSATATSGLAVTFASSSTSVCTISDTALTLVTAGACSITASQGGDPTHAAAAPVTQSFTVLTPQTITFNAPAAQNLGTSPILAATASSGLGVVYTSNSTSVCTVAVSKVTLLTAGVCSITANQAGDQTYAAAAAVTQTFTVNLEPQTITFNAIPSQALGTTPTLTATSTSGLKVSFASNSTSICTVSETAVALVTTGECSITASQVGNTTYAAATTVTQIFTVALEPQTITFGPINTIMLTGTPPALSATASSGLDVSFASNTSLICTVSSKTVTLVAAGVCSITATQAGNGTYAAATAVTQTFIVTTLTAQSITFGPIAAQTIGVAPPALSATASSGLPVTFASNSTGVCTVAGSVITLVSIGTCSITANQGGDTTHAAATSITQTFAVHGRPQTITFNAIPAQTLGTAPPALNATASSSLAVTYTSNTLPVCTVSETAITLVSAGSCSLTANQSGSTTYAAAAPVTQTFTVNLTPQTITFGPINTILLTATPPALSATATSGQAVNFASNSDSVCTVSGTAVVLVATGTCSITASQGGNTTYAAAAPVTQMFLVTTLTPQSITFGPLSSHAFGTTAPALSATATSGLAVTFASNSTAVCTVSESGVVLVSAGVCSITASQPGNLTVYAAATPITQLFTVTQGANVITFAGPGTQTLGVTPPALSATASSGLAVTFASTTTGVCTVSGATLILATSGTCTVTADQAGNTNYLAATPVSRSFTVNPASSGGGSTGGGGETGGGGSGGTLSIAPASATISAISTGLPGTAQIVLTYQKPTEGAPSFSTSFSVNQGKGWLSVSPSGGVMTLGSATISQFNYTATLTIGADASKLTPGQTYTGNVTVDVAGSTVSIPITVNVSSTPAKYLVSPSSLTFNYQLGGTATPSAQSVSIFSAPIGAGYTVSANSSGGSGNWLSVSAPAALPTTPSAVSVSAATSGFTRAGQFSGEVVINTGTSTISVPVTFNISPATPPVLGVAPIQETFSIQQNGSPATGQVTVSNIGGGTLQYSASASSDNGWLAINGSGSGSAVPSSPGTVAFTISPKGLKPGVYSGQVSISGASSTKTSRIVLTITNPKPQIQLSRSGVSLSGIAGGKASQAEAVTISNSGGGSLQWSASASTLSGNNWLIVSPASGTSAAGATGSVISISADPSKLTAGVYSGSVNVKAPGAVNSPQTISVTFTVAASQPFPAVVPFSGGVILVGAAGSGTPVSTSLPLFNLAPAAITYSASSSASWLLANPASGSLGSGVGFVGITANLSSLSAGLHLGSVSLGFGDGSGANLLVIVLALPAGIAPHTAGPSAQLAGAKPMATVNACPGGKGSFLIPIFEQPFSGSTLQLSSATYVKVQVIDDCGNAVTSAAGGSVQVTFSNGDPGINLVDTGAGVWEGTWTPATAASRVTLQLSATENGLTLSSSAGVATSETVTTVAAAAGTGTPQPTGIANAASAGQAIPQLVAPGSYVAIYGTNLAGSGDPNATAGQPLPTTLNGAQLTLGGLPLPLLYASPSQVNAVIPQGIAPNAVSQLVVVNGTTQSVPVPLTVTELQPGAYTVDTTGSGAGVVTDAATGQLITASNPAHAGQNLVIYMTGLGALTGANGEQEPVDGAIAPTSTIYHTQSSVSLTIGGVAVPSAMFSGLTPTLTALYQVNVQMPSGVAPGLAVPVVVTATDTATGVTASSNTVTIAVQ